LARYRIRSEIYDSRKGAKGAKEEEKKLKLCVLGGLARYRIRSEIYDSRKGAKGAKFGEIFLSLRAWRLGAIKFVESF
jgi:hypothetical protein